MSDCSSPTDPLDRLFSIARATPPATTRAEYAFETRLVARLREERPTALLSWAWRLCPYFTAVAAAAALWSHQSGGWSAADTSLLAASGAPRAEEAFVTVLTGEPRD